MKLRIALTLSAVCLVAFPLLAADQPPASPVHAGKWEMTVEMDMMGMHMPAHTVSYCVTKEQAEKAENGVPQQQKNSKCKPADVKVDGNTITWKLVCESQQMTGDGTITYDTDSFTGTSHIVLPQGEMKSKYSGKRVGDCDK